MNHQYENLGWVFVYQAKTFNKIFREVSNNIQIYNKIVCDIIQGVFNGNQASVFAYDQSGSSKMLTMMLSNMTVMKSRQQNKIKQY